MAGEGPEAEIERIFADAGLTSPSSQALKAAMVVTVREARRTQEVQDELRKSMDGLKARIAKDTSAAAAQAATAEVREGIAVVGKELSRRNALLVGALVVSTVVATWVVAREKPLNTPYGRLTPEQLAQVRYNDLGPAIDACVMQAPLGGRRWCWLGWWVEPPAVPK